MHNPEWESLVQEESLCRKLAGDLSVSPFLASLLVNRGLCDPARARAFIEPRLENLADPFELPDMERAVERIRRAVLDREKILIYGDYDADGITAAALLTRFFRGIGQPVETYLPCRGKRGYGLHDEPLEAARKAGARLVITVDCGTDACETVARALASGLDVIVTDHHQPHPDRPMLPGGVPNVNPQLGWHADLRSLSGVGVAFELARAAARRLSDIARVGEDEVTAAYLDLVAVGTIADLAPMRGQGRILTRFGLEKLRRDPCPAFRELFKQAGFNQNKVDSRAVGFILGPRLNAAGRMLQAQAALDFLLAGDESEITRLAGTLDQLNRDRQKIERRFYTEACRIIARERLDEQPVIIVHDETWANISGVAGIIAGRLSREHGKPAFVLSKAPDHRSDALSGVGVDALSGSGRCDTGLDLFKLVAGCPVGMLLSFGGHKKAVGVTLAADRMLEFRRALEDAAARASVRPAALKIEATLDLARVTPELVREIGRLAPFGKENEEPVIATERLEVQEYSRVVGKKHLKLWVRENNILRQGIGFNLGELNDRLGAGAVVDLAYTPRLSEYEGLEHLEMEIKGIRARD